METQRRKAPRRHSSIQSGSPFLAETQRTVSSLRPFGARSISISVTKPYLYFSPSSATCCLVSRAAEDMVSPHAAARGMRARCQNLTREATTASASALLEFQPKLTRIDERSSRPIAARTWDGEIFPDEQDEPELTITPSRSRAITTFSA